MLTVGDQDLLTDEFLSEWEELFTRDSSASPFSGAAWAAAWWPHWGSGSQLRLLTVRDGQDLVGLAPLALRRRWGLRVLYGLGTIVGNYWDVIAEDSHRTAVVEAVIGALFDKRSGWDVLSLDRLPPGSEVERVLDASPLPVRRRTATPAPELRLPSTFDEYLASLSANRRSKVRRYLRPLDSGEVELAVVDAPPLLDAAVARWQSLRRAWWVGRGRRINPEHDSGRFRRFTVAALEGMVPRGLATVWELRRDGEVIGVAINFVRKQTFYYWLGGFDPRFANLRLGHTVVAQSIRESIQSGRRIYDFMIGNEAYKYEYGAVDRMLPWLLATNPRGRSRAAESLARVKDRVRPAGGREAAEPAPG